MKGITAMLALLIALVCVGALLPARPQHTATAQQDLQSITVYITRTGKKYSPGRLPVFTTEPDRDDARANRYTPCSVCNPPR